MALSLGLAISTSSISKQVIGACDNVPSGASSCYIIKIMVWFKLADRRLLPKGSIHAFGDEIVVIVIFVI